MVQQRPKKILFRCRHRACRGPGEYVPGLCLWAADWKRHP